MIYKLQLTQGAVTDTYKVNSPGLTLAKYCLYKQFGIAPEQVKQVK